MSAGALDEIDETARAAGLRVRGALHPGPDDGAPEGTGTLVLIGPDEPRFWPLFTASPEYLDGTADPMDRWSRRVIGALAQDWGGSAVFPSDGPPYPPFLNWALASGRAWSSPVGMLVQDAAGLFVSYRGAMALPDRLDLPPPSTRPCAPCSRPCESACPVGALAPGQAYDVARCKTHLRQPEGAECRLSGCLVRRACPVAADFARLPEQSAFHMAAFLGDAAP